MLVGDQSMSDELLEDFVAATVSQRGHRSHQSKWNNFVILHAHLGLLKQAVIILTDVSNNANIVES